MTWRAQADRVTGALLTAVPTGLVGAWVHGSGALGGWREGSDLDVLVVVADGLDHDWLEVGHHVLAAVRGEPHLELSAVTAAVARVASYDCPYLFHVNSAEARAARGRPQGDPDLVSHLAVTRQSGIALFGPTAAEVVGEVPRSMQLRYLRVELADGLAHGDATYAVLNACRAAAYAETGVLLSKVAGAAWAVERWPQHRALVEDVRRAHEQHHALGPADPDQRALVEAVTTGLSRACGPGSPTPTGRAAPAAPS